jgi:ABC-type bacteriocin/lantibiotic exporter with double-glycine peptidase domain
MVLAFYGAEHSETELCQLFRTRGMGTSPARVMMNLPRLGFQALVFDGTMSLIASSLKDDQPCIVHLWTEHLAYWQGRDPTIHAVVVATLLDDAVVVNDPAFDDGQQRIPLAEFRAAWRSAGYLLMLVQPVGT